jgi:hypothetical protein
MSDISKVVKLLLAEGFELRMGDRDRDTLDKNYTLVYMDSVWHAHSGFRTPETYGDMPIFVMCFVTEQGMRKHARLIMMSLGCTFIRTFCKGKEDPCAVGDGVVPAPGTPIRADNPKKERIVDQLTQRSVSKKRKLIDDLAATPTLDTQTTP